MLNGINDLELECIENAICIEDMDEIYRTVKINIPKLMPMTSMGEPTERNIVINKNILLNDPQSMPNIDLRINACNYITMSVPYSISELKKGDSVLILIPNKNIKKMRMISL